MAWNEPGNKGNGNDPWGSGGGGAVVAVAMIRVRLISMS
jgi:hypothetical protein